MMIPKVEDLSYLECLSCKNYFFIHEIGMGINDPNYCPYCGVQFTSMTEDTNESYSDEN